VKTTAEPEPEDRPLTTAAEPDLPETAADLPETAAVVLAAAVLKMASSVRYLVPSTVQNWEPAARFLAWAAHCKALAAAHW
jgi:hypothetical protein